MFPDGNLPLFAGYTSAHTSRHPFRILGRFPILNAMWNNERPVEALLTSAMFTPNSLQLALLSAAILGFRHGFDYDHIAAITDITMFRAIAGRACGSGSFTL